MLKTIFVAASLATALTTASFTTVLAQDNTMHQGHDMSSMDHGMMDKSASSKAFAEANARMHKDMGVPLTGNADVDFVQGMIPHHQGAIDMAKIVLEHGKDPEIRKLAEDVIKAQEGEIAMMKEWLAKNGQ
ncbi:CopM family metallochaperone [Rhizobium sp. G187]|uniref:CopM family metallochaperone n=1 Tax=Rhizobium sp. G187 TaxID=3451352 RepID=UPI003EE58454